MKSIITNTGGQPLRLEDLLVLQENTIKLSEAIGLAFVYTNSEYPMRFYGCNVTVSNSGGSNPLLNITAGAMFVDTEIVFVDAIVNSPLPSGTTLIDVQTNWFWDLSTVDTDNRVFKDLTSHNVLRIKKAILTETPVVWQDFTAVLPFVISKATNNDAIAGTDFYKFLTPATVSAFYTSKLATNAETITGTNATKATTPASVKAGIDDRYASDSDVKNATGVNLVPASKLALHTYITGTDLDLNNAVAKLNGSGSNLSLTYLNDGMKLLQGYIQTETGTLPSTDILINTAITNCSGYVATSITNSSISAIYFYQVYLNPTDNKIRIKRVNGDPIESDVTIYITLYFK